MRPIILLFVLATGACSASGVPITVGNRDGNDSGKRPSIDMSADDLAVAGTPCSADDQCGAGSYCRGLLNVCSSDCQYAVGVGIGIGACHRSCTDGHCKCVDDADCPGPWASCDQTIHLCTALEPPICHAVSCPNGCSQGTLDQYGDVCFCTVCPNP